MLKELIEPLVDWYQSNKRVLPWRTDKNPYYIWVSEIMLQQTRVEAVKPYFQRFISALPTIRDLADCPEDRLLKLWEGLGYYNRVRNMQKAAITVVDEYGSQLPVDYEALKGLSGIGSYTAGAIASIAYGIAVPAVDGNVLRVLARVREDGRDIARQAVKVQVEKELLAVMPKREPGEFNQSLMELGALICLPGGTPKCRECPLHHLCKAHQNGHETEYPVKTGKQERKIENHTILLIQDGERIVLRKRPLKGLLAGLYEFPNISGHLKRREALEWVQEAGMTPLHIQKLEDAKHIFSHVEWHMIGYAIRVASFEGTEDETLILVETKYAEEQYPVPSAYGAYARYMSLHLGGKEKNMQRERK